MDRNHALLQKKRKESGRGKLVHHHSESELSHTEVIHGTFHKTMNAEQTSWEERAKTGNGGKLHITGSFEETLEMEVKRIEKPGAWRVTANKAKSKNAACRRI